MKKDFPEVDVSKEKATLKTQETKQVPLEPGVEGKEVIIGTYLTKEEEEALIEFLRKHKDVFASSAADLKGVSREIIEHSLNIDPKIKPKTQKLGKMQDKKFLDINSEV